jgi:hypothetical protein
MKVIGLTGNIGCGKSTVAGMLRDLGVAIIDADAVARQVRTNDGVGGADRGAIRTLDAGELARIVFSDPGRSPTWRRSCIRRCATGRSRLAELMDAGAEAAASRRSSSSNRRSSIAATRSGWCAATRRMRSARLRRAGWTRPRARATGEPDAQADKVVAGGPGDRGLGVARGDAWDRWRPPMRP